MAKIIVTGGSGFVGNALCKALIKKGHQVVSVSRRYTPELRDLGAKVVTLDLTKNLTSLELELTGADAIFHTAAKVSMWGSYESFYEANVGVTEKLLNLAQKFKVERFIFTSSPSVVANGYDLCSVDESVAYPKHFEAFYPETKAMAEHLVLQANGTAGVSTVALRPHLIFGPGDTNLIPTILKKAQAGRLVQIGKGKNLTDVTFIDDCIQAHIAAYEGLATNPRVGGRAFFVSQGEPVELWGWINQVLSAFEVKPITRSVPIWLAKAVATSAEWWCRKFNKNTEPVLTKFLVTELSTNHYFDISAAKKELGYNPKFSVEEGLRITRLNIPFPI
jgi:2-alkyl-3-oxoalkanoate reductase